MKIPSPWRHCWATPFRNAPSPTFSLDEKIYVLLVQVHFSWTFCYLQLNASQLIQTTSWSFFSVWLGFVLWLMKFIHIQGQKPEKLVWPSSTVVRVCVYLVAQYCPTLCNPIDCSQQDSSVHGIFQARILEWLPFPTPEDLSDPGIKPTFPALAGVFFITAPPGKPNPDLSIRLCALWNQGFVFFLYPPWHLARSLSDWSF